MKRVLLLLIICLLVINVEADNIPVIASHKVMVTNKEGTSCYKEGKKTDEVIPYKTMLMVNYDIVGSYINVTNDKYNCDVKYVDVSSYDQKFSLDNQSVEQITPIRALVLSTSGLNMRIGPSVTYSRVVRIPQNTVITLNYKSGTYWYHTEYDGKLGWITSMNGYIGYDFNRVLISHEKTKLYDVTGNTVLANIPENTEITDYMKLETVNESDVMYYAIYNGTKGYLKSMLYKTNGTGKIKLTKDIDIKDNEGKLIKKITSGSELEYTMIDDNGNYYFPERNLVIKLNTDEYEYIVKAKPFIKEKGYIGDGFFGEEKIEREEVKQEEAEFIIQDKVERKSNTMAIIIVCLLITIIAALTTIAFIKYKKRDAMDNMMQE